MSEEDEAYWELMGYQSSKKHALRSWQDSYLASCKLPEAEQKIVDAAQHRRYPWRCPDPRTEAEIREEQKWQAEQEERAEQSRQMGLLSPGESKRRPTELNKLRAESLPPAYRPRNCSVCHEPLPVGSPSHKSMHAACSKRGRMARYRQKKKDEKLKDRLRKEGKLQDGK